MTAKNKNANIANDIASRETEYNHTLAPNAMIRNTSDRVIIIFFAFSIIVQKRSLMGTLFVELPAPTVLCVFNFKSECCEVVADKVACSPILVSLSL